MPYSAIRHMAGPQLLGKIGSMQLRQHLCHTDEAIVIAAPQPLAKASILPYTRYITPPPLGQGNMPSH